MKFCITFKTPDALEYAIRDEVERMANQYVDEDGTISSENKEEFEDNKYHLEEEMSKVANKFIKYGELITIEFDTDFNTAKVINKEAPSW